VWRVGLMGANATRASVQLVVAAFRDGLAAQGWKRPAPKA
jgi:aspartate aminotransferase-like enzyme